MQPVTNAPTQPVPTVLVVEDDEAQRCITVDWLTAHGLRCATAQSVAEALRALEQTSFALMILDWGLDRCGREVLQHAKASHPQMPVVVLSGQPYDVRTDAIVAQADAFLVKPVNETVLSAQVKQLLQRSGPDARTFWPATAEDIQPLNDVKRAYVLRVLQLLDHNVSLAAEKLQVHRQTVAALLKKSEPSAPLPHQASA
jgi:DNA-binding response OmpR family regulator